MRGWRNGVKLHDFAHDVCIAWTEEHGDPVPLHRRLIDSYAGDLSAVTHEDEDAIANTRAPWWSDMLADDGYVHENLV
jgi:hypothetical protein